jgi:hypothetical protein
LGPLDRDRDLDFVGLALASMSAWRAAEEARVALYFWLCERANWEGVAEDSK